MMKTIKQAFICLCGILLLGACGSEVSEPEKTALTREVWVDLGISANDESLRVLQNVDDAGNVTTPYLAAGADVQYEILLCVKNTDGSAPVYQRITLKGTEDNLNKPYTDYRAKFSGKITVPGGTNQYLLSAVLLSTNSTPDGQTIQFASVDANNVVSNIAPTAQTLIGGEVINTAGPQLVQLPTKAGASVRNFMIPYIASDVQVNLNADGNALEPVTLQFKPSGKLIKFRFHNASQQSVQFSQLRVKTNAFFKDWKYNLSALATGNLAHGYRENTNEWEQTYPLLQKEYLPNSYHDLLYALWVMPTTVTTGLSTQVFLTNYSTGEEVLVFESANTLGTKPSQRITLSYTGIKGNGFPNNKLPYEYFVGLAQNRATVEGTAENINDLKTKPTLGVDFDESSIVYMNLTDANATVQSNANYKIPTMYELGGIFPAPNYGGISTAVSNTSSYSDFPERISVGGEINNYLADYASSNSVVYGVRFQDPAGQDKSKRMIYRYRYWGTFGQPGYHLEVNMKHIGADDTYDTPDKLIAAGDIAFADAYTLYFPGTGNTTPTYKNKIRGLLTTTGRYNSNSATNIPIHATGLTGASNLYPVPLFTKE